MQSRIASFRRATMLTALLAPGLAAPTTHALIYLDSNHGAVSVAQAKSSYNPVGAVKLFDDTGAFLGHGSGALITTPAAPGTSPNHWFLTAAHVVTDADSISVFFGDQFSSTDTTGDIPALDWYVPTSYDGSVVSESDIALIRLGTDMPLETFAPYSIFPVDDMRELENVYHMVGFGTSGNGNEGQVNNDGRKRTGRNMYEYTGGLNNAIVYSDFDIDHERDALAFGAPGEPNDEYRIARETSSAQGDSGGPQLMGDHIVSITSFGPVPPLFNTTSGDVRTAPWAQWIADVIADVDGGGDGSGVISGIFGDGATQGMTGTPISLLAGAGDNSGQSNFQYYSELLIRYVDPEDPMDDYNDVLRLLGLSKRSENLTLNEAANRLQNYGLNADITDESAILGYAQGLLDQSLSGLPDGFTELDGQELGHFGFLRGYATADTFDPSVVVDDLLIGDANFDGVVDIADLELLAGSWSVSGDPTAESVAVSFIDWSNGDFNGDFDVNEQDLAMLAAHWLQTADGGYVAGPTFAEAVATIGVPEPTSLALLGVAGAVLAVRRRKA